MPMRRKPNQLRSPIKAKTLSKYMHSNETKKYSPEGNHHHNLNNSMKWREYKTEPTILVLCLIRGGKKEILEMVSRRGATAKCFSFLSLPGSQLCLRLPKKKKSSIQHLPKKMQYMYPALFDKYNLKNCSITCNPCT